jgi:hypothetical protein
MDFHSIDALFSVDGEAYFRRCVRCQSVVFLKERGTCEEAAYGQSPVRATKGHQ